MGRLSKFRVWDKKSKTWLKLDHNPMISHEGKIIWFSYQGLEVLQKSDFEETWFTGRKDKNGKEIFGGDILESPSGTKFLVTYLEDRASFRAETSMIYLHYSRWPSSEVIGNIYETPELWENKK